MKASKWIKFTVLYLGAILLSVSQMKISPTNLRESFISMLDISPLEVSIYVSIFAFAPVFLAIPGGSLVKKYGAKWISILIMTALFLGNFIGYFTESYPLMLIARIIEGISFSFIMVTGMVLITHWFRDGGYGLAVGIFGTFSAFGYAAVIYVLPIVYDNYGLKNIWLVLAAVSAVLGLLFIILFDNPQNTTESNIKKASFKEAFKNTRIITLAIAMATVSFILFTFLDGYPTIFKNVYNLTTESSSFNSIAFGLVGIPVGFIIGFLIEKIGKPITIGFFSFIVMAIACFMTDKTPESLLIIQIIVLSTCISFTSTSIASSVPKIVKHPGLIEDSFAIIYLFYYIGALIGIPIVSGLVGSYGWAIGVLPLTVVALLGAVLSYPFFRQESKTISTNS
ncbi:MFS transporter [Dysgonomonas sp. Marseille-P4677]|uniref:MFS transporter n=1 Tax=Dysgonomonas sp. Marseille-P4677 TaxID=2364790 RepID=UPI0019121B4B|nr:MFS transporter [Dysgonomonas sp. Marseille-P4677]MBK5720923.1 MFS transporter [Dysgonomonas sp. Marseille-P4677]